MSCSVIEENYPYKPISNSVQKYIQVNSTLHRSLAENRVSTLKKKKQNRTKTKPKTNQEKEKYIVMLKHNKDIASLTAIKC